MGTDATRCATCGGEFSAQRVIIDGVALHARCAIMSHGSHTHEDMARVTNLVWELRTTLQKIAAGRADPARIANKALHELFPDDAERDRHFIDQYHSSNNA